jgi:hypothetical protein
MQKDWSNILQGWSIEKGDYLFFSSSFKNKKDVIMTFFRYLEKENLPEEISEEKNSYKIDLLSITVDSSLVGENGSTAVQLINALSGINLIPVKMDDEVLIKIRNLGIPQLSEALVFRF